MRSRHLNYYIRKVPFYQPVQLPQPHQIHQENPVIENYISYHKPEFESWWLKSNYNNSDRK